MRIGRATLRALLALAGAGEQGWPVVVVCGVNGGPGCRWAAGDGDEAALAALALLVIRDIGWKMIEHAAGSEVAIRCAGPQDCQIDFGDGFVALPADDATQAAADA